MTGTLVVILAIALVITVALVAVLYARQQRQPDLDREALRALLAQAKAGQGALRVPSAGADATAGNGTAGTATSGDATAGTATAGNGTAGDATAGTATTGGVAATGPVGTAVEHPRGADANHPAAPTQDARDQAAEFLRAARTEADDRLAAARAEATSTLAAARAEAQRLRTNIDAERQRMAAEAAAVLSAEREELGLAQQALRAGSDALGSQRTELDADRSRLLTAESDLRSEKADIAADRRAQHARAEDLRRREVDLTQRIEQLDARSAELDQAGERLSTELTRVSGLTVEDAKTELLATLEDSVRRDAALMVRRIEGEAQSTAKDRAHRIVADAIQRVASEQTAQSVVSVVHLPTDEIKGRIIGREGRNIRTFETVTGVNVIIDDTPEAVLLSCFDPVRRETGRVALQMLIDDGRIHPHRIEEAYERACEEVEALCRRAAEDALLEVGITGLHPELVTLLGRLRYRTSYGQNVLGHLIETAHIARGMAEELGVDPTLVTRGAFLHDIGKALTHENHGSHAAVGAELARRYGESETVAHAIEAHHDEVPPGTVEAVLTQAADACSGGRPGARRESLESYVQRLQRIEAIAGAKKGVDKVFAMQAGRELRVMVKPDLVDDLEAHLLAREVAKQIEEELTYPGQVRVTVIRESRATEIAR